eukprot:SAG31_NODE_2133_length_6372_cov_4.372071_10_plen_67_part_00
MSTLWALSIPINGGKPPAAMIASAFSSVGQSKIFKEFLLQEEPRVRTAASQIAKCSGSLSLGLNFW